jgi:hypothetical protein
VRVEANDRQALERLLRYCARPAFALERLREVDAQHLVYESVKPIFYTYALCRRARSCNGKGFGGVLRDCGSNGSATRDVA